MCLEKIVEALLEAEDCVVNRGSSKGESLPQVFFFEEWVLAEQLRPVGICGQDLEHSAYCDPHAANAGLPSALSGIYSDSVETRKCSHAQNPIRNPNWT